MINYWNNLNEREQVMLGFASTCVLIYLFYLLIYSPLSTAVTTRVEQFKEKKETLQWIQGINVKSINSKVKQSISNSKLLSVIASQLSNNSLKQFVYQLQQTGSGDIQLSYDRVPYNIFLQWLWSLSNEYTITIKQISIEKTDTAGVSKTSLILSTNRNS